MEPINIDTLRDRHGKRDEPYLEFLAEGSMSAGLYRLDPGQPDPQDPHTEDELYYITAGRATLRIEEEYHPVEPGDAVFVERGVDHEFVDIETPLETLVIFAPAEGSESRE